LLRGHLPIHDVIARDVHRCYPDHVHFRDGMGGTGQDDLHAILKAYAHYKPSVGYCQGMGRLVGMMLMQMPVEDAFWLLVATIESPYLQDYYTPTLRQLRVDAIVFERLLKVQDPKLAMFLEQNDVGPLMYITQWYLTLFTMSLPWASVLRVWDIFYFDGVKTLFRVGLGVLQICRPLLLSPQRGGHDIAHGNNSARAFFSGGDHNHDHGQGDRKIGLSSGLGSLSKDSKVPPVEDPSGPADVMEFLLHVPLDILGPEKLLERAFRIRLRRDSLEKMTILAAAEMDKKEAIEQERRRIKLQQQQQQQQPHHDRSATQEQAQAQAETPMGLHAEGVENCLFKNHASSNKELHAPLAVQTEDIHPEPDGMRGDPADASQSNKTSTKHDALPSSDSALLPVIGSQENDQPHSQPSKKSSMRSLLTSSLPASSPSSSKSSLSLSVQLLPQQASPSSTGSKPLAAALPPVSAPTLLPVHNVGSLRTSLSPPHEKSSLAIESLSLPSSPISSRFGAENPFKSSSPLPSLGIFPFRTRKRAGTLHQ
jgi:hypothetical protein